MNYKVFYVNDLRECCYVVSCGPANGSQDAGQCVIIDPGMQDVGECSRMADYIEKNNLKPAAILLTHAHFDHIMGNSFVVGKWNVPTYLHADEEHSLKKAPQYALMFGETIPTPPTENLIFVEDGQELTFGSTTFKVLHTPGHTMGSVSYLSEGHLFSGDTLFAGSIGRTDLPGGDYDAIQKSLKEKIMTLDPDTVVLPGHGPESTVASEISTNPFLQFDAPSFIQIDR